MEYDDWDEPLRPNGLDSKPGDVAFIIVAALMVAAMVAILVLGSFEK